MDEIMELPVWLRILILVGVPIVNLSQATWLYIDGRKRTRYYWFWALWGIVQSPMPFLVYWLFVRWRLGRVRQNPNP
ncbi:sigmaY antisigma factor component [Paenibacillus kobensis]|uniref:sigmaY antisigma factor component n=1 Tax=Paenibacillus kobensis TaxID=59841 RepID=UPI000FD6EA2A|nr:sigmaY antisigma factor component [Paenibacillus kobensis]